MKHEDETLLWMLAGIYVLSRYSFDVVPTLKQAGVTAYEALHDDQGHKRDLPGHQMTKAAIVALAKSVGFPNPELAAAIALAESGGVPNALAQTERETSVGLWQINLLAWPKYTREDMSDPQKNARAALEISKGGNDWRPWTTYTTGAYQRYL